MSTYILGSCDSGWFPECFTRTDDEKLLDEYCDLQLNQISEDAVHAYELVSEDHPVNDLPFISEDKLQGFVEHLRDQFKPYVAYIDF